MTNSDHDVRIVAISAVADQLINPNRNRNIEPEDIWKFTQQLDTKSFGEFIVSLAHKAGCYFNWHIPQPREDETSNSTSYIKRVEANFLELTGITLSNLMANSKSWIGVWAAMILDHGVTLIPEWTHDGTTNRAEQLENWFKQTNIADHVHKSTLSRIKKFLVEVLPQLRMENPNIDYQVIPMLVNDDTGFGVSATIRNAIDALKVAHVKNNGRLPHNVVVRIVKSIESGGKNPAELKQDLLAMGYVPAWVEKKYRPIDVGSYILGSNETGDKGIDYLVQARGDDAIEFCESTFNRAPFHAHFDLGGDADERRRQYKSLNNSNPSGSVHGEPVDEPGS